MGASATSFESQWEALQRIMCNPNGEIASSLKRTLFGDVDLEIDRVDTADVMTKDVVDTQFVLQLNVSQRSAVECALNHDITLIQGPAKEKNLEKESLMISWSLLRSICITELNPK